ncbi:uncharacterized protein VP01_1429g2 [Puccinia sorghi]|uniref:Uncharacterized protein n=1 Tax=Puccinia sorghi TaxID=27349 RepID=A0A0L6VL11_9BASI|nr:uncharacterized protein VP01_1429g2 [Puccinia sorghi]
MPAFPYMNPMPYSGIPIPYGHFRTSPISTKPAYSKHDSVALTELGINHYSQFQNFQESELEEAGMKQAHDRALTSSFKKFK